MPPNDHLRQHNWRGDEQNGNDIDQDEGAAAATAERVRKLPNVSKTDGGTDRGKYECESSLPVFCILACHCAPGSDLPLKSCATDCRRTLSYDLKRQIDVFQMRMIRQYSHPNRKVTCDCRRRHKHPPVTVNGFEQ